MTTDKQPSNEDKTVDTGGGPYVGASVTTGGGDFIGVFIESAKNPTFRV